MASAVVIGESLLDVVQPRGGPSVQRPGGSPLNVAVTLARLGVSTELVTALGDDQGADLVEKHLTESGVRLAADARHLPATSTAVAYLREDASAEYDFDIHWELGTTPLPEADLVHAGSIALFLEPGSWVVHDLLRVAATRSLVSLDPNIRPALLSDVAEVRSQFEALAEYAHVVKLSDEDAAWLYPELSEAEVLARILGLGPALTALSRGSAGALLAGVHGSAEVTAPRVKVADTIGAGDAFMGGLLCQLLEHGLDTRLRNREHVTPQELHEIGTFAAEVAAVTVSRHGADPPYRSELAPTA